MDNGTMRLINAGAESAPNLNLKGIWCMVDGQRIKAATAWPNGQVREFESDDALRVVSLCGPAIKLVDEPKPRRTRKKKDETTTDAAEDVATEGQDDDRS